MAKSAFERSASKEAAITLPAVAASAGLGALAAYAPVAGAGVGIFTLLSVTPWRALFSLFVLAAIATRFRLDVAAVTLQPAHLVLLPAAAQVVLLLRRSAWRRWSWIETSVVLLVIVQFISTVLNASNFRLSISAAALLAAGGLAYLATRMSLFDRDRLLFGVRALLLGAWTNAAAALVALTSHYFFATSFGVSGGGADPGSPPYGIAHEYNIQGSISACGAVAFLGFLREENPVLPRWASVVGFVTCFAAMIASLTRAAWIGFFVGAIALLLFRRPGAGRNALTRGALSVVVMSIGLIGIIWLARAGTTVATNPVVYQGGRLVDFGKGTGSHRVNEWTTALGDVPRSLALGFGTNSYGQHHSALNPDEPGYLGNLYVRTVYDTGLIGITLLLIFMLGTLWPTSTLRSSTADLAPVLAAFFGASVVLAVAYAATDATFQIWPWLVFAAARAARIQVSEQDASLARRDPGANGASGNGSALGTHRPTLADRVRTFGGPAATPEASS